MLFEGLNKTIKEAALLVQNNKSVERTALRMIYERLSLTGGFAIRSAVILERSLRPIQVADLAREAGVAISASVSASASTVRSLRIRRGKLSGGVFFEYHGILYCVRSLASLVSKNLAGIETKRTVVEADTLRETGRSELLGRLYTISGGMKYFVIDEGFALDAQPHVLCPSGDLLFVFS
jgi:hypothetical protein